MRRSHSVVVFSLASVASLYLRGSTAYAQDGINLGDCSPDNIKQFPFLDFFCRFGDLGALISTLLPSVFVFAGLILLVYIIVAGFRVIQNAGSGEDSAQTKQGLTAAVIGFFLIFASYFIIQLIQRITGVETGF